MKKECLNTELNTHINMKDNKEKWIKDIFESLEGGKRAKPNVDLFARIEAEIENPDTKVIPLHHLRMIAAAAIVLLTLNIGALLQYNQGQKNNNEYQITENNHQTSLISDYKLYE